MNLFVGQFRFWLKSILFTICLAGAGLASFGQTTQAVPPDDGGGGDPSLCTQSIALQWVSEGCLGAVLRAYPRSGCTYNYKLFGAESGPAKTATNAGVYDFNVTVNGNYYLQATHSSGVVLTSTKILITKIEKDVWKPMFSLSSPKTICPEEGVDLRTTSSQSGVQYQLFRGTTWLNTQSGTGSGVSFGRHSTAGDYKIVAKKVTNLNSCKSNTATSNLFTLKVTEYPKPSIAVSNISPCPGEQVVIRTDNTMAGRYFLYREGELYLSGHDGSFTVTEGGKYTIKVDTGCEFYMAESDFVQVTYQTNTSMTARWVNDNPVCQDDKITFAVSVVNGGSPSYTWTVNGDPTRDTGPTMTVLSPGIYGDYLNVSCKVTPNASGCTVNSPVTLSKRVPVNVGTISTTAYSCRTLADFYFNVNSSNGGVTYTLYNTAQATAVASKQGTGGTLNFTIPAEGTYFIKGSVPNGCATPVNTPTHPFVVKRVNIESNGSLSQCPGALAELTVTGVGNFTEFSWYDGNSRLLGKGPTQTVTLNNDNFIFRVMGRTPEGCYAENTIKFKVNENLHTPPNEPYLKLASKGIVHLYLNNSNTASYKYYWVENPDDETTTSYPEPREVSQHGYYYFRSVNSTGCWGKAVRIYVPDFSVPKYPGTGLPQNINYIKTFTYQEQGLAADPTELTAEQVHLSTTYFDGLGRGIQTVGRQSSPNKKDLISPVYYNHLGRNEVQFLPYEAEGTSGQVVAQPFTSQQEFYNTADKVAHDLFPFARTVFEPSPLNRILKQGAPGADWQPNFGGGTNDRAITYIRRTNRYQDNVFLWEYTEGSGTFGQIQKTANYSTSPPQLFVNETLDEHQNPVLEFTNKQGQIVLKEVRGTAGETLRTYYVYDDFGNLRAVLPPKFTTSVLPGTATYTADQLKDLCFMYHYDHLNRMTEKHVPGGGTTYMVYDKWDRLVFTQDAKLREENAAKWMFYKYDGLNRPVLSGNWTDNISPARSRKDLQKAVMSFSGHAETRNLNRIHGYTLEGTFPHTGVADEEVLTVTFYDDYNFRFQLNRLPVGQDPYGKYWPAIPAGFPDTKANMVKGLVTGTKTKVLGVPENRWLNSVNYYDHKYRLLQVISDNQLADYQGFDRLTNAYDFTGKTEKSLHEHDGYGSGPLKVLKEYFYDHAGRLSETYNTINNANRTLIVQNRYNGLGQLTEKNLHKDGGTAAEADKFLKNTTAGGASLHVTATRSITLQPGFTAQAGSSFSAAITDQRFLQSVDYRYNIRGWLTHINNAALDNDGIHNDDMDDVFGFELSYNSPTDAAAEAQYNGNIAEVVWSSSRKWERQSYIYRYDPANRLTGAIYRNFTTPLISNNYDVPLISYDANGNITNVRRNGRVYGGGFGLMDDLNYQYVGNQLMAVNDAVSNRATGSGDFFDRNGRKGSETDPEYRYDASGNMLTDQNKGITSIRYNHLNLPEEISFSATRKIQYVYDAAGTKMRKIIMDGTGRTTDYVGGFHYEGSNLKFIQHEEGRVLAEASGFIYQYDLKDHLGNARVSFDKDPATGKARVIQEDHYYPFGMTQSGNGYVYGERNKYLYNGKEFQDDLGLDMYDYGARIHDPALGRWHVQDPKAESYESISPYSYAFNNPIRFIDLQGKDPGDVVVIFDGADLSSMLPPGNGQSLANGVNINGGSVRAFVGQFWTTDVYQGQYGPVSGNRRLNMHSEKDMDIATQAAYDYIKESRKSNGEGKVIVYGYSWGGVLANHLAKRLKEDNITVDYLNIVDAANGDLSPQVDRTFSDNVGVVDNYYTTDETNVLGSRGDKGKPEKGNSMTKVNNKIRVTYDDGSGKKQRVTHSNIDEATFDEILNNINKFLNNE